MRILQNYRKFSTKTLDGWAKSVQKSGKNVFVKIDKGRAGEPIQLVANKEIGQEIRVGSAIRATGSLEHSRGAQQEMEFVAEQLKVVGNDENPRYDDLSPDNLRKKTHLRARNSKFAALLRARSAIFRETHEFFMSRDFIHIDTPKLTRNDCEGGGEVFDVVTTTSTEAGDGGLKEEPMFLSVSSQLHLEAMVSRLQRVYILGPSFRAERQQSHAHLSEFHMLEAEVAFVETIDEMCTLVESYIQHMISYLNSSKLEPETAIIGSKIPISNIKFPRIRYDEAVHLLALKGSKVTAKSGFSKKNELDLVKLHDDHPIFVTHYPVGQKPFYMARDGQLTLSFDLLVPGIGELAGGSLREQSAEELQRRGCGIDWYLEMRRRGQPPTGGFGIGFERMLQYLLGVQNIKDTVAFPRWHRHCQC
ncbi:Aminoacyl-transfer RNA synthetases class-II family profile domain-containing protein [Caenorhabditis elegans]|uniref:Aminoacyl-transfer RNA synthetases class-II family profile domain-containing protein n=1 Tax=Caenorhabditis elegans TaxID=6239 RepID=Q95PZ8_CAEEL|nr:Aminoacyl-transfer RNA synthetases class-II family profile domain-containing protein [Caenorhabditis elegans]CAC70140.2 Aminoacyl-transfer RNA synthetases class-II family profile domain-containing protein [Caenorhabditis elegans]|eukprot:NP_499478.2 asparaginyl(N) Amino-acyl tRNA Synthetase [Caenorhabditis elegans]